MMNKPIRRRTFLRTVSAAGASAALLGQSALARPLSANDRLNIAIVGVSGRGRSNLNGVKGENIVALCDIDDRLLARAGEEFPRARKYNDFRRMLEQQDIDAVVVSTADHTHAPASVGAMKLGKHVYCEKPLSHSVYEARAVAETAAKAGVATQMGTQIHAGDNYRRVVELIRSGAIGPVREVHVWCGKTWSGGDRPTETPPVPPYLSWDLWLGPAPARPYHPTYQPANWRRWWDFGNGTLGDMACHYMDLPFWALDLDAPTTVSAEGPPPHPETTPSALTVRYEFPEKGDRPGLSLTWSDGQNARSSLPTETPNLPGWNSGVLFVGDSGMLAANYGQRVLLPRETFADYEAPEPTIPSSVGHHQEWIDACKNGRPTTCHFGYSGPLTETVLLGNVAYRSGQTLEWDSANLRVTNSDVANRYLRRDYRRGWTL